MSKEYSGRLIILFNEGRKVEYENTLEKQLTLVLKCLITADGALLKLLSMR